MTSQGKPDSDVEAGAYGGGLDAAVDGKGVDGNSLMGWKLGRVSQVITRYVEQDEIIRSLADRIQANGSGTKTPK